MTFAEKVLAFYKSLALADSLPPGVEAMNPYRDAACMEVCQKFYSKFYNDVNKRFLILGINPGRYGAGITGIPFTDPIKLETIFGISNDLPKKPELSAEFIHSMIGAYGGYELFFNKYFINSVSPLGYVQNGKNLNYYDTPLLKTSLEPFIRQSVTKLAGLGIDRTVAFCLGEGENYKYIRRINSEEKWFDKVIPLAHPRFIMQYRRKFVADYIEDFVGKLKSAGKSGKD